MFEALNGPALRGRPDEVEELDGADDGQEDGDADGRSRGAAGSRCGRSDGRLAPSMAAASSSSRGMPWSPASMMIMWKPKYFHEMTTNMRHHHDRSVGQPLLDQEAEPDGLEAPGRRMPFGYRSSWNTTPVTTSDRTYGAKNRTRSTVRPRKLPVELQRQPEREGDLESERQDDDEDVVPDRPLEHRVGERLRVVVETDELGERRQAVPVEQAVDRPPGRSAAARTVRIPRARAAGTARS